MSRISVSLRSGSVTRFFKLKLPNSARPLRAAVRADGITQSRGSVPEAVLPPTRPSELRSGLRGQAMNNLPADVDATPEPRVADHSRQVDAEETYVGAWAPTRAACFRTEAPPLAISTQRAASFGGLAGECEFGQVRRVGAGWRTRARCFADGRSWTANVHLSVTRSTLIWSSERGRATYYRCG